MFAINCQPICQKLANFCCCSSMAHSHHQCCLIFLLSLHPWQQWQHRQAGKTTGQVALLCNLHLPQFSLFFSQKLFALSKFCNLLIFCKFLRQTEIEGYVLEMQPHLKNYFFRGIFLNQWVMRTLCWPAGISSSDRARQTLLVATLPTCKSIVFKKKTR